MGLGGVFPSAPDVSSYWQNILSCVDASIEVQPEHWVDDPSWFHQREQADDDIAAARNNAV